MLRRVPPWFKRSGHEGLRRARTFIEGEAMVDSEAIKALQAKLHNIHRQRELVEKQMQERRVQKSAGRGQQQQNAPLPLPPSGGSLFSRLGLPVRQESEDNVGEDGRNGRFGDAGLANRRRGEAVLPDRPVRRRSERDDEEEEAPNRKRLRSAVAVPGQEEGKSTLASDGLRDADNDRWDGSAKPEEAAHDRPRPPQQRFVRRAEGNVNLFRVPRPRRNTEEELKVEERGEVGQIYKKQDVQQRNRRLFGALMGHLGKAKERLTQDKDLLTKQTQVVNNVIEKEKEESERLRNEMRSSRLAERRQEVKHRSQLINEQRKTERELETARFVAYMARFRGFIKTKTEPHLYYLPKNMSEATRALLAETDQEIDRLIEEKKQQQQEFFAELDEAFKERWEKDGVEGDGDGDVAAVDESQPEIMAVDGEEGETVEVDDDTEAEAKEPSAGTTVKDGIEEDEAPKDSQEKVEVKAEVAESAMDAD